MHGTISLKFITMQVWKKCVITQVYGYTYCGLKNTVGILKQMLISMQYGTKHFKRRKIFFKFPTVYRYKLHVSSRHLSVMFQRL